MPRTHVAASFLPSSFPFPFLSSFSHPPLHPLWTTSQSPNAALAARVVPLLLPLFFFYIFAFLVVASAPARQRATRANAPQRHGSTYALHLIDAFIVRTAVGLFALTKDRLVGGTSRWKLRPFGISRLRHARKESNGNWNFFIREREKFSGRVCSFGWEIEGGRVCGGNYACLEFRVCDIAGGDVARKQSNEAWMPNVINIDEVSFFSFFSKGEKNSLIVICSIM